jgi:hypothetical protein
VDEPGWFSNIPVATNDPALQKARERNIARLMKADEADRKILGKYLPSCVEESLFPFAVVGPVDVRVPSKEWLCDVIGIAETQCKVPNEPGVQFSSDESARDFNTKYLANCDWDMRKFFELQRGTTIDHGSEFRPIIHIRSIVGKHPNFPFLRRMLSKGFEYILTRELSEEEREAEYQQQFQRGNHKSASDEQESQAQSLLRNDATHGFALPIRADQLHNLQGVHLQPGGIVAQFGLQSDGSRKLKYRFTHDLSYSITIEDASINSRVDIDQYPEMVYGWCFSRIIHYLSSIRRAYPGVRIYISKFDYSDAYKRLSNHPKTAASTVVKIGETAYIFLRMVFGGSPNPAGFSCFSEILTDLANELAMSEYTPTLGASPTVKDSHVQVAQSEDETSGIGFSTGSAFDVNTKGKGSFRDCFIDDIIDCHLGTEENLARAPHIVPMAVHVMSRPHAGPELEPIPRKEILAPEKLEAEGRSSERQIVLGWEIMTRAFKVRLPDDKYIAWISDVKEIRGKSGGDPKRAGVPGWKIEPRGGNYSVKQTLPERDPSKMPWASI